MTLVLLDPCLTGGPFPRGWLLAKFNDFNALGAIGLFDRSLTGRLAIQAEDRRILGLLREVTQ